MTGTAVSFCPMLGVVIVAVSKTCGKSRRLVVVNRTSVIIVTTMIVPKVDRDIPRHPAGINPTVTVSVVFPVAGNPVSAGIWSQRPIALYPNVGSVVMIPRVIPIYPDVVSSRRTDCRRCYSERDSRSQRDIGIYGNVYRNLGLRGKTKGRKKQDA